MNNLNKFNIALVAYPHDLSTAGLVNFITKILAPLSNRLFIIAEGRLETHDKRIHLIKAGPKWDADDFLLIKAYKLIVAQLRITLDLLKICKNCEIVMFLGEAELLTLPVLVAKLLLRKKVLIIHGGDISTICSILYRNRLGGLGRIIPFILRLLERVAFSTADQIVVQSEKGIKFMGLENYWRKMRLGNAYFIDRDIFKVNRDLKDRTKLVGYIGNFSEHKGAVNLAKAIPLMLAKQDDMQFLMIGGEGSEFCRIEKELKLANIHNKVIVKGRVSHHEIANYLNQLKLLVLPSCSEGIPKIILEAMACGTPVLATLVGGVGDLIQENETGLIMEDNSPECIAQSVIEALRNPKLGNIAEKARRLIEKSYTYELILQEWQEILHGLVRGERE